MGAIPLTSASQTIGHSNYDRMVTLSLDYCIGRRLGNYFLRAARLKQQKLHGLLGITFVAKNKTGRTQKLEISKSTCETNKWLMCGELFLKKKLKNLRSKDSRRHA